MKNGFPQLFTNNLESDHIVLTLERNPNEITADEEDCSGIVPPDESMEGSSHDISGHNTSGLNISATLSEGEGPHDSSKLALLGEQPVGHDDAVLSQEESSCNEMHKVSWEPGVVVWPMLDGAGVPHNYMFHMQIS